MLLIWIYSKLSFYAHQMCPTISVTNLLLHQPSTLHAARCPGCKVCYFGVFPSVDIKGQQLSGARASQAGRKLGGGPYALTSIRSEL